MKKFMRLFVLLFCAMILAGCAKDKTEEKPNTANDAVTVTPEPTAAATEAPSVTEEPEQKIALKIAALKGPTAMGMVKLMEDADNQTTANQYNFSIAGTADEISGGLIQGNIDIAAIPCNLASVLYNKTEGKIKIAGINTLGVLYLMETGDTIHSVEDLKGKTIYSTGLGTTPQYTLNYILNAHGIDPEKDVTIEYKTEATEVATLLSQTENAVAMLPQPFVTTVLLKNDKARVALDVAKEWDAVKNDESSVVTGVVVVRSDFLEQNKEAVDAFLQEYKVSAEYVNQNVEDAAALVGKYNIIDAAIAKKAIPDCNITMIQGNEMKDKVNGYLTALFNQNPKAVGGKMPADDFYYIP